MVLYGGRGVIPADSLERHAYFLPVKHLPELPQPFLLAPDAVTSAQPCMFMDGDTEKGIENLAYVQHRCRGCWARTAVN